MANLIACRLASYADHQDCAWWHLPQIGVSHVEVDLPQTEEEDATLRRQLKTSGLAISAFSGRCEVKDPQVVADLEYQFERCAAYGVKILFVSVRAENVDRSAVWSRFRAVGDKASVAGVTVVLETHPDLMTNADIGRQTMEAINHPNIRINFDTANIRYYNEHVDVVDQLAKVADYVAAVHLKDTTGGYRTWDFPALGRGIVDYPKVFRLLRDRGFTGPYTLELEGTEDLTRTQEQQLEYVAESVGYLKSIGVMDVKA